MKNLICILAFRFYQIDIETGNKKYFDFPQVGNKSKLKSFIEISVTDMPRSAILI